MGPTQLRSEKAMSKGLCGRKSSASMGPTQLRSEKSLHSSCWIVYDFARFCERLFVFGNPDGRWRLGAAASS
jgi:hypothetical protein